MKIARIETFLFDPGLAKNLLFCRVETESGIHGWGEAYSQYDRDTAVMAQLIALGRYAVGRDPFAIKQFTQMAFDDSAARSSCSAPFRASSRQCGTSPAKCASSRSITCSADAAATRYACMRTAGVTR